MTPTTPPRLTPAQTEALASRFALKISVRLDEGAAQVGHDVGERLRVARQHALESARLAQGAALRRPVAAAHADVQVQRAPVGALAAAGAGHPPMGVAGRSRGAMHGRPLGEEPPSWGWRLASALPLAVLLAGLWGIHSWYQQEQIQAAAEVDVALLSDELPPAAYADPGFEEFLREPAPAPTAPPLATTEAPDTDTAPDVTLDDTSTPGAEVTTDSASQ